jgi:hypothetical protein
MSIDKFYTQIEVAKECIDLIPDIDSYDIIIEPSAGDGSFSSQLNCIAYDIEPEAENIIKQDWLTTQPIKDKRILVIGNPPFGPRSSLAKAFIRHSQAIGAETIAFILPDTFSKLSNQSLSLFPKNWKLIVEHKLSNSNFTIQDSVKPYFVPCTFYIWTKRESNINLRQVKVENSEDFEFLPRNSGNADFTINGNSGKVKNLSEVTNSKAEHYIKARKKSAEELRKIFEQLDYTFLSSVNGGNAWIGQQEILKAYQNFQKAE